MRYIIILFLVFNLFGCSSKGIENFVENSLIATSGNKPPNNFKIANIETMRDYVFDMPDYSIALPSAKEEDFTLMNGWEGATFNDRNLVIHMSEFGIMYHIHVTTSFYKYTESERAIEREDLVYINNRYHKYHPNEDISLQRHGKENYICEIMEGVEDKYLYPNKEKISFGCYKFNSTRTKAKMVGITLTYQKSPNFPKEYANLTKDYTFEDLQQRAKRMLNSLYIKNGWE